MKLFSERKGIERPKVNIQTDNIDNDLRTGLWNSLFICFFDRLDGKWLNQVPKIEVLVKRLWIYFFKKSLDELNIWGPAIIKEFKTYFFNCSWYKCYNFIESVIINYPADENDKIVEKFFDYCNDTLKSEFSGYRLVGNIITPVTSKEEIEEIEKALENPLESVQNHMKRSLELLSDKTNPDYRNSIKEAISAVEAICKIISKNDKATLGDALNEIEKSKKIELHPALKGAFNKMYGYTNDEDGIRHSLMDKENVDFEDAKFMLVSCSAFINYLIIKSSKGSIKL